MSTGQTAPERLDPGQKWTGPYRRYDIVKEFTVAFVVMALLTIGLAAIFSSPDKPAISLQTWARNDPNDFVATAVAELNGGSDSAGYGAPYTHTPDAGQSLGPLHLQQWFGVTNPIDPAQDFVLRPLEAIPDDPPLATALAQYTGAPADQQNKWATDYGDALSKAPDGNPAAVTGDYGPVPLLATRLLAFARSGGLDAQLTTTNGSGPFYTTNYTKPLLFLADGGYLSDQATQDHLLGGQWGMMNETGRYPGQAWLWLYTFWYQIPPFTSSPNADAYIWAIMMVLSLLLILVPFLPGIRSIPRWVPLHRLIWRDYYRRYGRQGAGRH